jgi:predicted amidohydrolase
VQREPELYRAFGIKGAELVLRTATGSFKRADAIGASLHNGYWSALVNNAWLPDDPEAVRRYYPPDGDYTRATADSTSILSVIIDPEGRMVAVASSPGEQVVSHTIPIAEFRANHRQPVVHKGLYEKVMAAYVNKYPPNAFGRSLPETAEDAAKFINSKLNWRT